MIYTAFDIQTAKATIKMPTRQLPFSDMSLADAHRVLRESARAKRYNAHTATLKGNRGSDRGRAW